MSGYKNYQPNSDIHLAFGTEPLTTGIASDLRAKYYNVTTPETKVDIVGVITEDGTSGSYLLPAFQISTTGKYRAVLEYTADAGATYIPVAYMEFDVICIPFTNRAVV